METGRLALIVGRFSDHSLLLHRLVREDRDFHDLCEECALAQESLDRFELQSDPNTITQREEYRGIIAELELEIAEYLKLISRNSVTDV